MNKDWELQKSRITNISLRLRKKYYAKRETDVCYFDSPHGISGNMTESIGSWPEFIFRGTFCKRTFKGYCSPCFYSQFPIDKKETGTRYVDMIRCQFDFVIDNFDELVVKRQQGSNEHDSTISFVLTPTGSYFDEVEFPQYLRIEMLEKLVNKSKQYKNKFHLLIECHCKDWNNLNLGSNLTQHEIYLLKELNTRILFGFESENEYVRNVLYNKNLEMNEFLMAYETCKDNGLDIGIFIFAGLFAMNDALTIEDVRNSIRFAIDRDIAPVIMFQNVQQYTITDILFQTKKITLIEPFTVMEIVLDLINELEQKVAEKIEWLIADPKGGPPVPEFNIFDCAKITSKENADKIYRMVHNLRLTRNLQRFKKEALHLKNTENYSKYQNFLKGCSSKNSLVETTNKLLEDAEQIINNDEVF